MKFLPPSDADYIRYWTMLTPGELIYVIEKDRTLSGRVDVVTEDGAMLWLHLEAGAGRRLFTLVDGVTVWRVRAEDAYRHTPM